MKSVIEGLKDAETEKDFLEIRRAALALDTTKASFSELEAPELYSTELRGIFDDIIQNLAARKAAEEDYYSKQILPRSRPKIFRAFWASGSASDKEDEHTAWEAHRTVLEAHRIDLEAHQTKALEALGNYLKSLGKIRNLDHAHLYSINSTPQVQADMIKILNLSLKHQLIDETSLTQRLPDDAGSELVELLSEHILNSLRDKLDDLTNSQSFKSFVQGHEATESIGEVLKVLKDKDWHKVSKSLIVEYMVKQMGLGRVPSRGDRERAEKLVDNLISQPELEQKMGIYLIDSFGKGNIPSTFFFHQKHTSLETYFVFIHHLLDFLVHSPESKFSQHFAVQLEKKRTLQWLELLGRNRARCDLLEDLRKIKNTFNIKQKENVAPMLVKFKIKWGGEESAPVRSLVSAHVDMREAQTWDPSQYPHRIIKILFDQASPADLEEELRNYNSIHSALQGKSGAVQLG